MKLPQTPYLRGREKRVTLLRLTLAALLTTLFFTAAAQAQQSQRYGPYELHYSVVNTTFIEPEVADQYGIARGKRRAILNLSLREHLDDGTTVARAMTLDGRSRDLMQKETGFDFIEVREGPALYYIGEFKFINREWRYFDLDFIPEGGTETLSLNFKQQLYINE